ncbi:MAG: SPOR domain-containing protein [Alkalimonas sp.]|nr:SPOR domain-containing protein [Alkalimonas sp.]
MTRAFKQRLLGACILMIAAVVFLPDLLDGEKQVLKDDFEQIPTRPEFAGVQEQHVFDSEAVQQRRAEALAEHKTDEQPLDAAESESEALPSQDYAQVTLNGDTAKVESPATPAPEASRGNPALTEQAWTIRVGSFGQESNAKALEKKLQDAGFRTYTRQITNSNGVRLTSVFVGPDLRRSELEQQVATLRELTGVEQLRVSSYQPLENN